jgi:hypothetical protein
VGNRLSYQLSPNPPLLTHESGRLLVVLVGLDLQNFSPVKIAVVEMFKSNSLDQYNSKTTEEVLEEKQYHSIITANNKNCNNNNFQGLTKTPSRTPPIAIAVPATTSKVPHRRSRSTPGRNFFAKLFRTSSNSAIKTSRGGLGVTKVNDEKVAVETQSLSRASSAVLLGQAYTAASRTDFSGAVISIENSTTNSTETEGSFSASAQRRINSRHRQSYSLNSSTYITSTPFPNKELGMTSNSPPVSRRLLAEEDLNLCNARKEDRMEKSDTKGFDTPRRQAVDDALLAASRSPECQIDMLFVEKSSTSSDADDDYIQRQSDLSRSKCQRPPMTSRGTIIPTPAVDKRRSSEHYEGGNDSGVRLAFARPLRTVVDSPATKTNLVRQLESDERTFAMAKLEQVEEDDDAFLPDDFHKPATVFSEHQVQQKLQDAKKIVLDEARREFDRKVSELEQAYNDSLMEHGLEWRREKEAEQDRLTSLLLEEKVKTSKQQQDLHRHSLALEEYKRKVEEYEQRRKNNIIVKDDNLIAQELYKNQLEEKITSMKRHLLELQNEKNRNDNMVTELRLLQEAKVKADHRIEELEQKLKDTTKETPTDDVNRQLLATKRELEERRGQQKEIVLLKGGKAEVERQAADLYERLRIRTEANNEALVRLEDAEDEISCLKSKLSEILEANQKSTEELYSANVEIEKLRILRTEDEKELETVRSQMERVDEQYRAVLYSPQRSIDENPPESPCSQVDILRLDNNKAHEQLKAMGKVRIIYRERMSCSSLN